MADVPKTIPLTGVTASTDFGTVPANKAWIIKSVLVFGNTSTTDIMGLRIGGDDISASKGFATGTNKSVEVLQQSGAGTASDEHSRTVIAEASEVVRLEFLSGSGSKNARLSYIEVDV